MKTIRLAAACLATVAIAACTTTEEEEYIAPAPPIGPGAIVGTVAADRNGDGIVDGYYDSNGNYFAYQAPPCPPPPPPPPPPTPYGERG